MQFDEVGTAHDILQTGEAHISQILAYFLCQEAEIIYHVFIVSAEVGPQLGVLGRYAHGAGV